MDTWEVCWCGGDDDPWDSWDLPIDNGTFDDGDNGDGGGGGSNTGGDTTGDGGEEPEAQCLARVEVEYSTCVANFRNRYSQTISQQCTRGGFIDYLFTNCVEIAEAERDAGLASCEVDKATAIYNECN